MMKAILLFAMMSTVMGLRRAPPMPKQAHINPMAWAGVDDIDADMEYELLATKYREGVAPVNRVVKPSKKLEEKNLKCVPANSFLMGISHVEDLDQICFLE
mmetsp:Transcript_19030/g.47101  ORF Transcript_19030/g.47101 Transcript_19030/m.47101 type:complete len:101 (-) Transcript_19030:192-494(-)